MSKPIRYDSLLVRDLAGELHTTLAGGTLHAVLFDREALALTLRSDAGRFVWELHPVKGGLRRQEPAELDGNVMLPRRARVERIRALPDERILTIDVAGDDAGAHGGALRTLVVELLPNQWNVLALANDARIAHVLRPRVTRERTLQTGDTYAAPAPNPRTGRDTPLTLDAWHALIGAAAPGERVRAFTRGVAYASPLNAHYVIAQAEHMDDAVPAAHARYLTLVAQPRRPCVLAGGQPYGMPIDAGAQRCDSLLDAFAAAADAPAAPVTDAARAAALENAVLQARRARAKVKRLRAHLDAAPLEAAAMRSNADLLLAQVHRVPKGAAHVTLDDFAGGSVDVALDVTMSAVENASQLYTQARKRERAAARLPKLIAQAEREAEGWQDVARRIDDGTAEAGDIDAAQPAPPQHSRRARQEVSLPYRVHHTSSGLEVRVGRGAKGNDALTLHHAHGNDIWLHARDVGGAHVILRWQKPDENPPQQDLLEAAALAAYNSKARTSGMVPVDWTRRKYVRKPRKSPPGRVTFERGKTVFVEPAMLEQQG